MPYVFLLIVLYALTTIMISFIALLYERVF